MLGKLRDNLYQHCVNGVGVLVFLRNFSTGDWINLAQRVRLIQRRIAANAGLDTARGFGEGGDLRVAQDLDRRGLRRDNGKAGARGRYVSREQRQRLEVTRFG